MLNPNHFAVSAAFSKQNSDPFTLNDISILFKVN